MTSSRSKTRPAERHRPDAEILVTLAERPHPFPSRTRKLSSPAPKILRGQPFGNIGRRQDFCVSRGPSPPVRRRQGEAGAVRPDLGRLSPPDALRPTSNRSQASARCNGSDSCVAQPRLTATLPLMAPICAVPRPVATIVPSPRPPARREPAVDPRALMRPRRRAKTRLSFAR